jgi:SEL1 protein
MYTLDNFAVHAVTSPENTYIYDILPTALGLVSISSDDKLRLLDPLNLGSPAVVKKINQDVTSLRVLSDEGVVVTGGRDGRVEVLDLRSSGKNVAKSGQFYILSF